MKKHFLGMSFIATLSVFTLLLVPALAGEDPYDKEDDTWIYLNGTVHSVARDAFLLDYGEGIVTVEMDDGDRDADGYKLAKGDKVSVSGLIDDDVFETTTIEASSVYVENLGTHFYASATDDEDPMVAFTNPLVNSHFLVEGTVTDVDSDEFSLYTGTDAIRVNVEKMPYDPLDEAGYQQIELGDRVSVSGSIDESFFGERTIEADSVITIRK